MSPADLRDAAQREPAAPARRPLPRGAVAAWAIVALLALATAAAAIDRQQRVPGEGSAEAGFARDMATHHAQAVAMGELIRARTANPAIRITAVDIVLTQQAQMGRMHGWLDAWGLPVSGPEPAMAWMGMPTGGLMPGMASRAELNELAGLSGVRADARFLQLMIPHHQAGVEMAQAALDRTRRPEVRRLAQAIVAAQQREIAALRDLLAAIPGAAEPPASGNHSAGIGHSLKGDG